MSSDRCFFAFLPVIHALLINVVLPGGGFIALLLVLTACTVKVVLLRKYLRCVRCLVQDILISAA